jgi:preprotein translocase subunit SecG
MTKMGVFSFLAVGLFMNAIAVLFFVCAVALILVILIQKGRGGGLSAAFGGGAAGGLLGTKTGDFLTWVTIGLVSVFLLLAVVMAKFYKPSVSEFPGGQPPVTAPAGQPPPSVPPAQPRPAAPPTGAAQPPLGGLGAEDAGAGPRGGAEVPE